MPKGRYHLSTHAESTLRDHRANYCGLWAVLTLIFIGSLFGLTKLSFPLAICLWVGEVSGISILSWRTFLSPRKYVEKRQSILDENDRDAEVSIAIKQILAKLASTQATDFPSREEELMPGLILRPVKVQDYPIETLRGHISGWDYRISGHATPELLDPPTIVKLANDDNSVTLRVIIPNKALAMELFQKYRMAWQAPSTSYTGYQLEQGLMLREENISSLGDVTLIDRLEACTDNIARVRRPAVKVKGQLLPNGMALATSLICEGRETIFLPTGFFANLADELAPYFPKASRPAPSAIIVFPTAS